jgi:hypothetical protein
MFFMIYEDIRRANVAWADPLTVTPISVPECDYQIKESWDATLMRSGGEWGFLHWTGGGFDYQGVEPAFLKAIEQDGFLRENLPVRITVGTVVQDIDEIPSGTRVFEIEPRLPTDLLDPTHVQESIDHKYYIILKNGLESLFPGN